MLTEPLSNDDAKRLAARIVASGTIHFSGHARTEMADDQITEEDVRRVLRGGWCELSEFEKGSWRYRIRTRDVVVVVSFWSETELVVVTAWRIR